MQVKLTTRTVHTVPVTSYIVLNTLAGCCDGFESRLLAGLRSVDCGTTGRTRGRIVDRARRATVVMKAPSRKVR